MTSYSTPPPPPPPPPQYYHPASAYDSPSISTPPVPPPKPPTHNTPPTTRSQYGAPPVPPPPRRSSKQAPTWPGHDREGWGDSQYDGGGEQQGWQEQYRYDEQEQYSEAQDRVALPPDGWVPDVLLDRSKTDLHELLNNPQLLTSLMHHPAHAPQALTASEAPLHTQLTANTTLATALSALEAELSTLRDSTSSHVLATRGLEANWRKKQKEMEVKLEAWGPRELYNRLRAAIVEGEGSCRAVEEGWVEDGTGVAGEREVSEWVRRVREGRRVVALRRERRKRWDEGRVGGWR